jgi:hypothetical protein
MAAFGLFNIVLILFVGVAGVHHFGWEGLALPAIVWLLMPWHPRSS